ncbi:hypothetical protein ACGFIR_09620 [Micromonospora sp. NPDC049051]
MKIEFDGSCLLQTGGPDRVADEGERAWFVEHPQRRYCGDR